MKKFTQQELSDLQSRHEGWLKRQSGVIGTSVGLGAAGDLVLRIFTAGATSATRQAIAAKLSGVPLDWEEGEVVAD